MASKGFRQQQPVGPRPDWLRPWAWAESVHSNNGHRRWDHLARCPYRPGKDSRKAAHRSWLRHLASIIVSHDVTDCRQSGACRAWLAGHACLSRRGRAVFHVRAASVYRSQPRDGVNLNAAPGVRIANDPKLRPLTSVGGFSFRRSSSVRARSNVNGLTDLCSRPSEIDRLSVSETSLHDSIMPTSWCDPAPTAIRLRHAESNRSAEQPSIVPGHRDPLRRLPP